jgi:hypothetical protein
MITEIIVVALVAYRVFRLLGVDTIGDRIRPGWAWLACPWCLGTWIALGVAALGAWIGYIASDWLVVGIAAATIVGLIGNHDA